MSYVYAAYDNWDGGTDIFDVHLTVDARKLSAYTKELRDEILTALSQIVAEFDRLWLGKLVLVPKAVPTKPLSNQALDPRGDPHQFRRHGMRFRSESEVAMFDALVRKQAQLRKGDTILIVPLPSVWNGRQRWEPDFIVTYRGRAGVI
jgi:hypothetical protein